MGLTSIVTKALPYTVLGVLPDQDFLGKQLNRFGKWYDPRIATAVSGAAEGVFGLMYVSLDPFGEGLTFYKKGAEGFFLMVDGFTRSFSPIAAADSDDPNDWRTDPIYKQFSKKGSLFLEVPYYPLKKMGEGIYSLIQHTRDYYNKDTRTIKIDKP
tara:strand:- start:101 stop:568 length:468 start_codon:yes stop_codon:yes gene_type:complete